MLVLAALDELESQKNIDNNREPSLRHLRRV